jgi:hypothetical protein
MNLATVLICLKHKNCACMYTHDICTLQDIYGVSDSWHFFYQTASVNHLMTDVHSVTFYVIIKGNMCSY